MEIVEVEVFICVKEGLYRIWCGVNRLGNSGVHTLGDTSAFVNPAGQLLLTRRGKIRMDGVGILFEFYIAPLIAECMHTTIAKSIHTTPNSI